MAASAVVAIVFFGVSSFVVDRIIAHTVRENARKSAAATARVTFAGMYQLMSTGWSHDQAGHFIASIRAAGDGAGLTVQIYRGPVVERNFGPIVQPPMDESLHGVLSDGRPRTETVGSSTRYLKPLVANERCPVCHTRARPGDVLGVIEVKQDDAQLIAQARREFGLWLLFLAPLAMSGAALVVWRVNRRIEQSIAVFDGAIAGISAMSDLRKLEFAGRDLGFEELNRLFGHLGRLVDKLRAIAVDKDVLRFEIGLLEKFVITSEVVRDWGEYVSQLLVEINRIMTTHVLFSLFKIDDAAFDLEVFWARRPSARTRAMMEDYVRRTVAEDERFGPLAEVHLRHREPQGDSLPLDLDDTAVTMQTKALILDKPKIGGIVGIGVNSTAIGDDTIRLVMDSVLSTMLNVIGSVKAIHKYTGDMEYFATRDPLTDLFNRRVFWELLEYEEARARRHGYEFGILVIDLDSFKLINDTHGHMIGDRYLQAVARAMKGSLRPGDILGRYGGDEFVVLLPETGMEGTTMVARRLLAELRLAEVEADDGRPVSGSASIGLAVFPLNADNVSDLFLFADNMMYKVKEAGKDEVGVPSEEEVAEVFRDVTHTTMLVVNAVNEGRILPYFQPIMDIQAKRVVGFEVLSRMELDGQHVAASRFIEYAEKAGVIHRMDVLVLERALSVMADQKFDGHLFVNLSPRAFAVSDFLKTLKRVVADRRIDPGQIVFEITERDTIRNMAVLEGLIRELKMDGFRLAIDDFGSGFSSFQYLRRFPVDFLKIEGDFIAHMLDSEKDRAFVQTIYRLATDLGIRVVAEYVETEEVLQALREMGIELAQGYFIGRPGPGFAMT